MRRKLVAGNWKMNGSLAANAKLLGELKTLLAAEAAPSCEVVLCIPAPYFSQGQAELAGSVVVLGAQDLSMHEAGAYTGEVSASMLRDFDCRYAIVGHSERRDYHRESDQMVAGKAAGALKASLTPIVCVGETQAEREQGLTEKTVLQQLNAVLDNLSSAMASRIVLAYEPVWAIGTGQTATPDMVQQVHAVLRKRLYAQSQKAGEQVRILYGGSVKPENAIELFTLPDVDGGLIGGASLQASDFIEIIRAACIQDAGHTTESAS